MALADKLMDIPGNWSSVTIIQATKFEILLSFLRNIFRYSASVVGVTNSQWYFLGWWISYIVIQNGISFCCQFELMGGCQRPTEKLSPTLKKMSNWLPKPVSQRVWSISKNWYTSSFDYRNQRSGKIDF